MSETIEASVSPGLDMQAVEYGIHSAPGWEQLYPFLYEESSTGVAIVSPDGRVIDANPAFCAMYGYTRSDLGALYATHLVDADARSFLTDAIRQRRSFQEELVGLHSTGVPFQVEFRAGFVLYEGEPFVLLTCRDMTSEAQAWQMLEGRVSDRMRELLALYDVTAVASVSLDLEGILERSLDRVLEAVGCRAGAIHLLDDQQGLLRLAAWRGLPSVDTSALQVMVPDTCLAGAVVESGELVFVSEPGFDGDVYRRRSCAPLDVLVHDLGTYVGAPMRARGQVLGVLSLVSEKGQQFNTEEIALLASIADQMGVAVENARLYEQAERLAVMEERERLARELHDSVTQSLYSVTLLAESGRRAVETGNLIQAMDDLRWLGESSRQALKEMRLLVYELRPPALEREGLSGALQQRLDAVEGRAGIETRLLVDGDGVLDVTLEVALYRIAIEALNNALKHAAASTVTVHLRMTKEYVSLDVLDNGRGFDLPAAFRNGGMGLYNMRQRTRECGGFFRVHSARGEGTKVYVRLPCRQRPDHQEELWTSPSAS